ncbi:MAG: methyltransferase [bacterium]|nr:methyltransferase [bacterium]
MIKLDFNPKKYVLTKILSRGIKARHIEPSLLLSADDQLSGPNDYLMRTSLDAIKNAQKVDLSDISRRRKGMSFTPDIWPGEHYKLLAGFMLSLKPKLIVEIGTSQGLSALAIKKYMPQSAKIVTFDLIPWQEFPNGCLTEDDFKDGRMVQCLDNLTDKNAVKKHAELLENADFIFIDAAKDGVTEYKFLNNFEKILSFKKKPLIFFDDIRLMNMIKLWRAIPYPKIDLTSFGSWAGSGVIQWKGKK